MSELRTNRIVPRDGLPSGSSGGIIQVKSVTKTDTFAEDVSAGSISADAMSLTITPTRSDSKILLLCNMSIGSEGTRVGFVIYKGGSALSGAIGDASSSRGRITSSGSVAGDGYLTQQSTNFLDSPGTTSAVTYSIRIANGDNSTQYVYLNRTYTDTDTARYPRTVSTITAMEVSG